MLHGNEATIADLGPSCFGYPILGADKKEQEERISAVREYLQETWKREPVYYYF